jgi:UDP-N-acetylmuramoyl-L-alanyl-D-glutamate--2,6-diaminopimelate ligase
MRLRSLLGDGLGGDWTGLPEAEVTGITPDSRTVQPGSLFVAVSGTQADGHRFAHEAAARGAVAVVGETLPDSLPIPYVGVPESRLALAHLAAAWYGHPARQLVMLGVTGTDGKTTTCSLLFEILRAAGLRSGLISTVNAIIGDESLDTGLHVTTPEAMDVQSYLARMVAAGLTHCVLEATSHGLSQRRVAACDFDLAVVTNITHEHLDYHGSYEAYRAAKGLLFEELGTTPPKPEAPLRAAILNRDDPSYGYLSALTAVRTISYGLTAGADVSLASRTMTAPGQELIIRGPGREQRLVTSLVGRYNISNCLAAFAAAVEGLGLTPEVAAAGIASMRGVPGRMEVIDLGQPFMAIVDFAHTPNALGRALETVREMSSGKVIAVFGSAGLRDREKRRLMAEASVTGADLTILTAEDPRTEPVEWILAEMADGAREAGGREGDNFRRIPDRGEAIRFAVSRASPGDVVIACGKGHEQSMCFGDVEYPWDDRVAMRAALGELLGLAGPTMPQLPTGGGGSGQKVAVPRV